MKIVPVESPDAVEFIVEGSGAKLIVDAMGNVGTESRFGASIKQSKHIGCTKKGEVSGRYMDFDTKGNFRNIYGD